MSEPVVSDENADQAAYWNGPNGAKWVDHQSLMDQILDPIGCLGMDAASIQPGETIIDVGCGCGATSLALADRVAGMGRVLGVDISEPMLSLARQRVGGRTNVSFECWDASVYDFSDLKADLIFSRFGVMFFHEPVKAFANLRRGLKPGGRMTLVCWRPLQQNGWMSVPLQAALTVMEPPPPPLPNEPGPFAFADDQRVRAILTDAGFTDIGFARRDLAMTLGAPGDTEESFASALHFALTFGPLGRALAEMDPSMIARVRAAISSGLGAYRTPNGVRLPAAVWIVTARNPT